MDKGFVSFLLGKKVKEVNIRNNFKNTSIRGFYNPKNIFVGIVYKTPTGRNSKIYKVAAIPVESFDLINSDKIDEYKKSLERYTSKEYLSDWIKDIKNPRQQLVNVVVSLGENAPVFKVATYAL